MKNIQRIFCLTILTVLVACNSNNNENKVESKMPVTDTRQTVKKFADIQFASKRDTTCGMPISAGLEDTLVLNGKVYGFCSTECKDEFVTVLKRQHKR